ncbi:hypothetical protein ACFLS0_02015 [Candidatus Bipolaricaulota bacterium]
MVLAEYWGFNYYFLGQLTGIRDPELIEQELALVLDADIGDWPFWNRQAKKEAEVLLEQLRNMREQQENYRDDLRKARTVEGSTFRPMSLVDSVRHHPVKRQQSGRRLFVGRITRLVGFVGGAEQESAKLPPAGHHISYLLG